MMSFAEWCILENNNTKDYWYRKLSQSYKEYQNDEQNYHDPDNVWGNEDKFWIFDEPVHEIMKSTDCLEILSIITDLMKSAGFKNKPYVQHNMMNDFQLDYGDIEFSFTGAAYQDRPTPVKIITKHDPKPNEKPYTEVLMHVDFPIDFTELEVGKKYENQMSSCRFELRDNSDIPDIVIDMYRIMQVYIESNSEKEGSKLKKKKDEHGNIIYTENSEGEWVKTTYFSKGMKKRVEKSDGTVTYYSNKFKNKAILLTNTKYDKGQPIIDDNGYVKHDSNGDIMYEKQ